jgi:hypothetical protein
LIAQGFPPSYLKLKSERQSLLDRHDQGISAIKQGVLGPLGAGTLALTGRSDSNANS